MSNIDESIAKIKEFYDSAEGQASMEAWAMRKVSEISRLNGRLNRFHNKYSKRLDEVIERVVNKYNSDEYRNREYRLGYEPRESLLWFLFSYAEKYCVECKHKKYYNTFTRVAYHIGSYIIQVMDGQGSVIRIEKSDGPVLSSRSRFNMDANSIEEAVEYIESRVKQLLQFNYFLTNIQKHEWGVDATFQKDGKEYQSIYILRGYRGQKLYPKLVTKTILTSIQCKLEDFLIYKKIDYVCIDLCPFEEYSIIEGYYGGDKAKRSGVYLMNHIDEGLAILNWIGASTWAKKAYALHPIYQADGDLETNADLYVVDGFVLIRAMEYRSVANEYLSKRIISSIDEIRMSPMTDVNLMLIADKIQNRKDFELYHEATHPRSQELAQYFRNWLERLGVTEEFYQTIKSRLV